MENNKENLDEDNYNSLRNVILIMLILLFAYLIEKTFPNSFLKNIYFFLVLFIILVFIIKIFFYNFGKKFNSLIDPIIKKVSYVNSDNKIKDLNKEKLDKIKNIYECGYLFNKRNDGKTNYVEQNQFPNFAQSNYYHNINKNISKKNDEYLAHKISNINKINKNSLIDTFNKDSYYNKTNNDNFKYYNDTNYNISNFNTLTNYDDDNKYSTNNIFNNKITNLPSDDSKDNQNYLGSKNIISNPFKVKINTSNSKDSSSNFFLFSNNKIKKQNIINNINDNNPINSFNYLDTSYPITSNFSYNTTNKIPKDKEVSYNKYQILKKRNENTQALNQNYNSYDYSKDIDKIPKELININYNNWMIKLKIFISQNLIPNILAKHDTNINNLNNILSLLGLKIISTSPEDESNDYLNILNEKLSFVNSNKLEIKQNSDFLYESLKKNIIPNNYNKFTNNNNNDNKFRFFPSLNNFNNYINYTK